MKTKVCYRYLFIALIFCSAFLNSASAQTPVLAIAPSSVIVNYTLGASAPAGQTVMVTTSSAGTATITGSSITYNSGPVSGWLTVPPSSSPSISNGSPGSLTAYVTTTSLVAGNYAATVNLTYSNADPSSANSFTVFLVVSASGGGPGNPGNETITAAPTSLSFSYTPGSTVPAAQTLTVTVSDSAAFSIAAVTNDGNPWLVVNPGSVMNTVNVAVNPVNLSPGSYMGTITLQAPYAVYAGRSQPRCRGQWPYRESHGADV